MRLPVRLDVDALLIVRYLVCLFFAVCFIQSSIDKVTDRKGNLEWLTPHFSKTPFKGLVPLMLSLLTALELATGLGCLAAVGVLALHGPISFAQGAMGLVGLTLLVLFAGQRIARDYVGAASLAGYFTVALLGLVAMLSSAI